MVLESVRGPEDLKGLSARQLEGLAAELRSLITAVTSRSGGHVGPSLGAVELALAVHSVFSSPRDVIIWDVGHQAYAHKILTGRREAFSSLRQKGGISGYPERGESEHDHFGTGHASTSVSAAMGFAKARDLGVQPRQVVAILGDGALTGGLAYEAMNHAGQDGTHLIVILNDNSMSISPNVGAMARYLARLRSAASYRGAKARIKKILERVGPVDLIGAVERIKGSIKYLLLPGIFFETLGFTYLGPVDGHDIAGLQEVLRQARDLDGPVLVHAVTRKGRGYGPAEAEPSVFHGPGPYDLETGRVRPGNGTTWSQAFGAIACQMAEADPRVVAITAAMRDGTGLGEFARRFPNRFFDVGIAEGHAVTFAAGLAAGGMRPLVAIYSTFLQRAYDQVVHDVARQGLPVALCLDRAGVVGEDGSTHQGLYDLAYLRHIPGMTVACPRDVPDLKALLQLGLQMDGPLAVRYPRAVTPARLGDSDRQIPGVGQGELLRAGNDVLLLGVGTMVEVALAAARLLEWEGIRAAVIDARFVKPLDESLVLEWAARTGRVVTAEEHVCQGGFGSAVLEALARAGLRVTVKVLGIPDEHVPHGARAEWLEHYGLTPQGVAQVARGLVSRHRAAAGGEA
ncbi:MAG: 1-deoxy-D-xylulose-5-phosphate synthase [Bacillota bacterium]|nr:1-deoxy-D-xylulose-5-phosphate synthase [Bacillota bacterium]